jgi:transcriptional regulator with XRE-family HTH domain
MSEETFIKEDLIALRKELGLTQQEMAARLDMALRSYQAIEAGESEYRSIHRLAAERVALMVAADKKAPALAPTSVRDDAIELVRVGEFSGNPAFFQDHGRDAPNPHMDEKAHDARFRAAYGVVGELVLITTALEQQLNHVLIQALHLADSSMLESVIATLDMARKIEMLKARSGHISERNWRKPLLTYLDKLERISKWRNIACHNPLIPNDKDGAVFAPTAAAKVLKTLKIGEQPTAGRIPIADFIPEIKRGESALFDGQVIIQNLQRMNAERRKRSGK